MSPIDFVQEILCLSPVLNYPRRVSLRKKVNPTFSTLKYFISKLVRYVQFGGHPAGCLSVSNKKRVGRITIAMKIPPRSASVRRAEVQYLNVLEHKKDKFST